MGPSGNRPVDLWNQFSPNFRGMLLMGISAVVVSISHTLVRGLSAEIHPMQIGLFRTVIPLFLLIPMLVRQGQQNGEIWWRTNRPGLQLIRGVFGGLAMMTWFYALSKIPVGDATALSFTVVIFATVMRLLRPITTATAISACQVAGSSMGAAFLKAFAGDQPWTHIDIAGTAWQYDKPYIPKGPSGYGVRLLIHYLENRKH